MTWPPPLMTIIGNHGRSAHVHTGWRPECECATHPVSGADHIHARPNSVKHMAERRAREMAGRFPGVF